MSNLAATVDRVLDLAEAICDQSASPHDFVELDSMVLADETSRGYYWDYCQMHVTLEMEMRLHLARSRGCMSARTSIRRCWLPGSRMP